MCSVQHVGICSEPGRFFDGKVANISIIDIFLNESPETLVSYLKKSLISPERTIDRGAVGRFIQGRDKPKCSGGSLEMATWLVPLETDNEHSILSVLVSAYRTRIPGCPEHCVLEEQQSIEFNHANSRSNYNGVRIHIQHYGCANGLSGCNRVAFCGRAAADARIAIAAR
jgi:hypothetical protein